MPPTVTPSIQLALSVVLLAAVSASANTYEGYGTVYTLSTPSSGNCNFMSWPQDAATKYAALNVEQWDETMNCGRCAEVSCTDASCSGQASEIVYIMDQCPGCEYGDLDLSPDVFDSITGQSYTKLSIEWKFVDCPVSSNVQYCLKTGSSEFWVAVQPANFVSGVQSMSINGQETTVIDSAYYFLVDGSGESVADLSSVSISITGVNGEVIEETLSLTADECTDGTFQFSASSDDSQTSMTTTSAQVSSTTSAPTTAAPTTEPPTQAPTASEPTASAAPASTAPATTAPPATTTPILEATTSSVSSSSGSSSFIQSSNSSVSAAVDEDTVGSATTKINQVASASGSSAVQATVTTAPSAKASSTATASPGGAVQSSVQSSGGSHSNPLMIGMIVLVCAAVLIAVALAVYVRRRKQQIDAYKRREEQGTAMSDEDTSPRASDASSAYDIVQSPTVHFSSMESMGGRV